MENDIDLVMRVGSENVDLKIAKGDLKIKKSSSIKNTSKIDLAEIIEKYILPKLNCISLKDLSVLINGLIVVYYRQQISAYSEIQDIHDSCFILK